METKYDIENIIAQLPDPHYCECDYWEYGIVDTPNTVVRCDLPEDVTVIKVLTFRKQVLYIGNNRHRYEWVLIE